MKKICGWCSKILPDVPGNPDAVTVGLCAECDERVRKKEGLPPPAPEDGEIQHREPDIEHREPQIKTRSESESKSDSEKTGGEGENIFAR